MGGAEQGRGPDAAALQGSTPAQTEPISPIPRPLQNEDSHRNVLPDDRNRDALGFFRGARAYADARVALGGRRAPWNRRLLDSSGNGGAARLGALIDRRLSHPACAGVDR